MLSGRHGELDGRTIEHVSLAAACELACAIWSVRQSGDPTAVRLGDAWSTQCAPLGAVVRALAGDRLPKPNSPSTMHGAPTVELCQIRERSDVVATHWHLFLMRFRRSLENAGFSTTHALALSKALGEMADNAAQHSGPDEDHPAAAIVGYHVAPGWMSYSVADTGQGVLRSLRSNPKWTGLSSSQDALDAAVQRGATRRIHEPCGHGFSQVHKSIAALNGYLRFRSDDGVLVLDGRSGTFEARFAASPTMNGFQVSVTCAPSGDPADERVLPSQSHCVT